jgi:hypothetical protein
MDRGSKTQRSVRHRVSSSWVVDPRKLEVDASSPLMAIVPTLAPDENGTWEANLFVLLHRHVKERGLGKLLDAPTDCILSERTIVQPDIVFFETGRLAIISESGSRASRAS